MVPFLIITSGVVAWLGFILGRVSADRRINANHHKLAMFSIVLRSKDDTLAILSTSDRKKLDGLIDDYTRLNAETDE